MAALPHHRVQQFKYDQCLHKGFKVLVLRTLRREKAPFTLHVEVLDEELKEVEASLAADVRGDGAGAGAGLPEGAPAGARPEPGVAANGSLELRPQESELLWGEISGLGGGGGESSRALAAAPVAPGQQQHQQQQGQQQQQQPPPAEGGLLQDPDARVGCRPPHWCGQPSSAAALPAGGAASHGGESSAQSSGGFHARSASQVSPATTCSLQARAQLRSVCLCALRPARGWL